MSALAELKRLPQNMAEVNTMSEVLLREMENMSDYQLAEVMTYFKLFEKVQERISKADFVKERMQRMTSEQVEVNGFRIDKHTATSYDYSVCDLWNDLKKKLATLEATMKAIDKPIAETDTGELIFPAIKKSSDSFKLTLKK